MNSEQAIQSDVLVQSETAYTTWVCLICGITNDEQSGWPEEGLAPGTRWIDVPDEWRCPDCGVGKSSFEMVAI